MMSKQSCRGPDTPSAWHHPASRSLLWMLALTVPLTVLADAPPVQTTTTASAMSTQAPASPAPDQLIAQEAELARLKGERDRTRRLIARLLEIKQRAHFFPGYKTATAAMAAYHARLVARIEDCALRHFPKRNGVSVYGKGEIWIELDRKGQLVATTVETSSGDPLLDDHIVRVVAATAPFGTTPDQVFEGEQRSMDHLVIWSNFAFKQSNDPVKLVKRNERCKGMDGY